MKKLFYIVLLIVVLLVTAHFVKNNHKTNEINGVNVDEVVTIATDDVILINDGSDEETPIDSIEEIIEDDFIEENPDLTADDGETIIEE